MIEIVPTTIGTIAECMPIFLSAWWTSMAPNVISTTSSRIRPGGQ